MTVWLKRLIDYWKDKKLAEKCGLNVSDICVHEWRQGVHLFTDTYCMKCGTHFEVTNDN